MPIGSAGIAPVPRPGSKPMTGCEAENVCMLTLVQALSPIFRGDSSSTVQIPDKRAAAMSSARAFRARTYQQMPSPCGVSSHRPVRHVWRIPPSLPTSLSLQRNDAEIFIGVSPIETPARTLTDCAIGLAAYSRRSEPGCPLSNNILLLLILFS